MWSEWAKHFCLYMFIIDWTWVRVTSPRYILISSLNDSIYIRTQFTYFANSLSQNNKNKLFCFLILSFHEMEHSSKKNRMIFFCYDIYIYFLIWDLKCIWDIYEFE